MRCVAGVGLLVLVGCNQIFGIAETQPWDAAIPVHYATLTRLVADTAPDGTPAAPATVAFTGNAAPQIRIAALDGAFMPADYGSDGRFKIPASFVDDGTGKPPTWRLEYTLPEDPVPHEVQWAPDDNAGHIVVPLVGRADRQQALGSGGYTITPSVPQSFANPQVWTTGLWSVSKSTVINGGAVDYAFSSNAASMSGSLGRPESARGDRAFLVDRTVDAGTQCTVAVGDGQLGMVDLTSTLIAQTVPWDTQRKPVVVNPVDFFAVIDRLGTALAKLEDSFNAAGSFLLYGVIPSLQFPGLTGDAARLQLAMPLPIPVMQILLQCPYNASALPSTVLPGGLADLPLVLHMQLVDSRDALGVRLYSGFETVIRSPGAAFQVSFPAAMATSITLTTPAHPAPAPLDLSGTADSLSAGAPSGPFVLDFVPEPATGLDLRADYHDVILHRIAAGALTTERIYTVTRPQVRIDPAVLTPGADYVFEIRSYKGHKMAAHGDFATIDYPYGSAVVFTRTFKTP